jgi:hypothetical protein
MRCARIQAKKKAVKLCCLFSHPAFFCCYCAKVPLDLNGEEKGAVNRDPGADIWSALSLFVGPEGTAEQGGVRVRSGKKIEIEETRFFCENAALRATFAGVGCIQFWCREQVAWCC